MLSRHPAKQIKVLQRRLVEHFVKGDPRLTVLDPDQFRRCLTEAGKFDRKQFTFTDRPGTCINHTAPQTDIQYRQLELAPIVIAHFRIICGGLAFILPALHV